MFWRIKLFPQFIPSLKHIKMFWIFNSHQALATRSWLWRELLDVNYRMLSPNLPWSLSCCFLVSPRFFPGHRSLFYLCELFLQTVQCFSSCLLMRCQLDHFRQNHFVVIILVMSHFFTIFWPLDRFLSFGTLLYYQAPFLSNLRSVDRVACYEAWWTWRLHKKGRWVLLGPGRIIIKILYGEVLHRSPNTSPFIYRFCEKGTPSVYLISIDWAPLSHT